MDVTSPHKTHSRIHFSPNAIAHVLFVPNGVITIVPGPLLPLLSARWGVNDTQTGYLVTAQFVGCLLATLASGEILPWLGLRWTMVVGLAFMTFGTATLMASNYAWAIFALSCNGLGIGLSTVALIVAQSTSLSGLHIAVNQDPVCDTYALRLLFCWERCSLSISEPKSHLVFGSRPMPSVPVTRKGGGGLQFSPTFMAHCSSVALLLR